MNEIVKEISFTHTLSMQALADLLLEEERECMNVLGMSICAGIRELKVR